MATTKSRAPEVIKGSHLSVTHHKTGTVIMEWDWDALLHEVRAATLAFESKQELKAEKAEKKVKKEATKKPAAKKSLVKETEAIVSKARAKKATAKKPAAKKATKAKKA